MPGAERGFIFFTLFYLLSHKLLLLIFRPDSWSSICYIMPPAYVNRLLLRILYSFSTTCNSSLWKGQTGLQTPESLNLCYISTCILPRSIFISLPFSCQNSLENDWAWILNQLLFRFLLLKENIFLEDEYHLYLSFGHNLNLFVQIKSDPYTLCSLRWNFLEELILKH